MQDLMIQVNALREKLNQAIVELQKRGINKAQAENNYRVALAEKILHERDKGVPVTIISDICRGDKRIAKLKMERDIAEVLFDTSQQVIYTTRQEINTVMKFIEAERKGE